MNNRILNYFEKNELFPKSQHGFRKARSTFSAVSQMHEKWLANKEKKKQQAVSFLDLSAAFDTLSKEIICQKLKTWFQQNKCQVVPLLFVRKNPNC